MKRVKNTGAVKPLRRRFHFYKRIKLYDGEIYLNLVETAPADDARGFVPSYIFEICLLDNSEVVGEVSLRVGHSEEIYYAGNIGYRIHKPYRGNRYAMKACFLLEPLARKHDMRRLIITCDPGNTASRRTCELFGAKYIETVILPHYSEMYLAGSREKEIYEKNL